MNWKNWLKRWDMTTLKIKTSFLEMEWNPQTADQDAAWELYIELLTRITTQELINDDGDEQTALESIYEIFELTREIIKKYKRDCIEFTKIAIVILNQIIRPFTAKWHKISLLGFTQENKIEFRKELKDKQAILMVYTQMLGEMAGVEKINDLTLLEQ
ncbi:hypothetical protein [Clostridium cellulovorans]|uniref:Uncharacterized protein n=1 Tax=Clostridium cellulovorans (strain ATCC 35296 / DSM 3052 / OCM 3 / 743B) TaxID=573061 RepID=D9SP53_CLOC7|nr:hypothetical protein [Clostridium cellulovorans]ADL52018.1 hypothetical protein Clocel_2288 [Clostridium cellulovorans 743B]